MRQWSWSQERGTQGHGTGSLKAAREPHGLLPGPNVSRRRFVEFALAAVGGVTLSGLAPPEALADDRDDGLARARPCDGERLGPSARGGRAGRIITAEELGYE